MWVILAARELLQRLAARLNVERSSQTVASEPTRAVDRPLDSPLRETAIIVIIGVGFLAAQYFGR